MLGGELSGEPCGLISSQSQEVMDYADEETEAQLSDLPAHTAPSVGFDGELSAANTPRALRGRMGAQVGGNQ